MQIGPDFDPFEVFLHDVPDAVRIEAGAHAGPQAGRPMAEPHPLQRWPAVPTRFVLARQDRFFPAEWQRGVVRERLRIGPNEMDGGHCVALSRPEELVALLEGLRPSTSGSRRAPRPHRDDVRTSRREVEEERISARAYLDGDPIGWFDDLYAAGASGRVTMPWNRSDPHPLLTAWTAQQGLRGDVGGPHHGTASAT